MNIKLDLKPHIGKVNSSLAGEIPVRIDQYVIVASGEDFTKATNRKLLELGYVGTNPRDPINWLPSANLFGGTSVLGAMAVEVTKKLAEQPNANQEDIALAKAGLARGMELPMSLELAEAPVPDEFQDDTAGSDENL